MRQSQPPPPPPPPPPQQGPTQGLIFSHIALILSRLTAYLPPHEAPLLREVSAAFSTLEAQHRGLQEEVDRLRAAVAEQQQEAEHARSQAHAHAMTTTSTAEDPTEVKRRIHAYRKAVQDRNEKIAELRREKEEALQQVQEAHKERLHESESRAQQLEVRAERESLEVQQLAQLALSMQKTLEGLQAQVTTLSTENIELKLRMEAAARKREQEKEEEESRRKKDQASKTKSKAGGKSGGGGTTTLRWGNEEEEEGAKEKEEMFHLAINTHPKELLGGTEGVADYSSGEDERFFDYHDVTVLDEGEEEDDEEEEEGEQREDVNEPPPAPKRRAPGGGGGGGGRRGAAASSASYFKMSSTAGMASKRSSKASQAPAHGTQRDRFYLSTLSASVPQHSPIQKKQVAAGTTRKRTKKQEEEEGEEDGLLLPFQTARNRPSRSIGSGGGGRSFAQSHEELAWTRSKGSSTGSRLSLDELLASLGLREGRGGEEGGAGQAKTKQRKAK